MKENIYTRKVWSMAIASSFLNFVCLGISKANGLLFVALMEEEKSLSRGAASWPFNLSAVAVIFVAPLTGFMMVRFSPFCISFIGSVLIFAGSLPCYFSTNVYVLSACFGVLKGFGFGMITILIPSVINKTFKRHRGTAMGIALAGISAGGLIWPILVKIILERYGLKSTFLWLTVISLSTFLFGMAYTQYPDTQKPEFINGEKLNRGGYDNTGFRDENTPMLPHSSKSMYKSCNRTEETEEIKASTRCANDSEHLDTKTEKVNDSHSFSEIKTTSDFRRENEDNLNNSGHESEDPKNSKFSPENTVFRKGRCDRIFEYQLLKNVFTNRGFYMISLSQMVIISTSTVFTQVIVDYLSDKGIPVDLSLFMMTSLSVGEAFGMIGLGWVTDKKFLSRTNYSALTLLILANMPLILTFTQNYNVLMTAAFLLGTLQGTFLSINIVQIGDYVSKDEISLAMSFCWSINGAGAVIRPPIIGLFRDQVGSYDYLFRLLAGAIALLGIGWGIEGIVGARKKKKNQREELKA